MRKRVLIICLLLMAMKAFAVTQISNQGFTAYGFVFEQSIIHIEPLESMSQLNPIDLESPYVAKSAVPATEPGLKIAVWSMMTNYANAAVKISHNGLSRVSAPAAGQPYDYELAVDYLKADNTTGTVYVNKGYYNAKTIFLTLSGGAGSLFTTPREGIYFRLLMDPDTIETGLYQSTVTFELVGQ